MNLKIFTDAQLAAAADRYSAEFNEFADKGMLASAESSFNALEKVRAEQAVRGSSQAEAA